ncbi:hypothetical protein R6Z07F_017615 [Ovis aries]
MSPSLLPPPHRAPAVSSWGAVSLNVASSMLSLITGPPAHQMASHTHNTSSPAPPAAVATPGLGHQLVTCQRNDLGASLESAQRIVTSGQPSIRDSSAPRVRTTQTLVSVGSVHRPLTGEEPPAGPAGHPYSRMPSLSQWRVQLCTTMPGLREPGLPPGSRFTDASGDRLVPPNTGEAAYFPASTVQCQPPQETLPPQPPLKSRPLRRVMPAHC